ncbi:hypothetical protein [Atopobium sp. oral taxon 810]|uniref:hypothetical protein n=1 Tax=Atopobium sp. oral taxon 810 TaxID=712158 RepID=UPI000396FAB6|nr:hypothetical protein [Atopobium sp. oral taxon 810]ERI05063.1 hypothetical protein HMPREF9069_01072 [Atopobium sp. oral taxon 810 str. F0209]
MLCRKPVNQIVDAEVNECIEGITDDHIIYLELGRYRYRSGDILEQRETLIETLLDV